MVIIAISGNCIVLWIVLGNETALPSGLSQLIFSFIFITLSSPTNAHGDKLLSAQS
jgi:hypothetical protein